MCKCVRKNIIDRVEQFGLRAALAQSYRAMIRSVYKSNRHIVFVIPEFGGYSFSDSVVKPLTNERIIRAVEEGDLNEREGDELLGFAGEGCAGVCIEVSERLAGYSWAQFKGEYRFGRSGLLIIPPRHVVIKNVYVFSKFRGKEFGRMLIAACLALMSSGYVPVILTMKENRRSIRNCEKCGFQRTLEVKRWCWFNRRWHMSIVRLVDDLYALRLEQALIEGYGGEFAGSGPRLES